ncbi:MAG: LptF/LptG family permease [Thermogutta sp.]
MPILVRYVTSELAKIFLTALLVLTLLLALGIGAREGISRGLPPILVMRMLPYLLPEILGITIPTAVLLAVSQVLGRMSGSNEIIALRASGLSPAIVVRPTIIFAFFVSLFTVGTYDLAATWGRPGARRVVVESVEQIAYSMLRTRKSYSSQKISLVVKDVIGKRLISPIITIQVQPETPAVTLTAEEAELFTDRKAGALTIVCRKPVARIEGQAIMTLPETYWYTIPFDSPKEPLRRDSLAMSEIPAAVRKLTADARQLKLLLSEAKASTEQRNNWEAQLHSLEVQIRKLQTEPYRRWANGFSSLCFTLLGCPLAMYRRSENFLAIFFLSFLPIVIIYYPLLMLADGLTSSGTLPSAGFWIANLAIALPGTLLLYWYCET